MKFVVCYVWGMYSKMLMLFRDALSNGEFANNLVVI